MWRSSMLRYKNPSQAECGTARAYTHYMQNLLKSLHDDYLAREATLLHTALEEHGWRITTAAHALGVPRSSLRRALTRHPEILELLRRRSPYAQPTSHTRYAQFVSA